ncbi:hypothetical protein Tco_1363323 [Tanacetum coccineum]
MRGPVEVRLDRVTHPVVANNIPEPAQEGAIEVTYETLGDLVQRTMPNTRSGVSRTREGVNEQSDHRMAEALRARDIVRNLGPFMGDEGEREEVNGNGGNGNRNGGNRNGEMEMEEIEMVMGTEENMAITLEDLCLLESAHIKTS